MSLTKVTPEMQSQPLTLGTAVATTSGSSKEFTGIPSWVKRITIMLDGVSCTVDHPPFQDCLKNGGELQDADGNVMSADKAKEFVATLP